MRIAAVVATGLLCALAPAQVEDPVPNGSFERVDADRPEQWFRAGWAGRGQQTVSESEGRDGSRCARISSTDGADIAWACHVPVLPFSTYRLSGWIRTVGLEAGTGRGALLNVHGRGPEEATPAVVGDSDWRQVDVELQTADDDVLQLNCLFGGWGRATGTAYFDDVSLVLVRKGEVPEPRVTVDASRAGAPISPFVYGQFIEHLGRCIQGGIWAEMLPDRKFFHALGRDESPWRALGGPEVAMDGDDPFVGAHTPVLSLPGGPPAGLCHGALPLTEGAEYVGRVWYRGDAEIGAVEVTLRWGDGDAARATVGLPAAGPAWQRADFRLSSGATTDDGELAFTATGAGTLRIGCASLMPADHVGGMRRDTLALLEELDAPVYRWPGGNFVSGYDWKDGVGDPDRRPPRKNPAWRGIESNDFGFDEFIAFCNALGTEPYVAVNAGAGDAESAAEQVQYANGPADTPMGARRAANGSREPYGVRIWGIGNEMYGSWQIGHMPVEQYADKHVRFADAMRAVDPGITLVAVGAVGGWDEVMLRNTEGHLDHFSEHIYVQERPGLFAHVRLLPDAVRRVAEAWRGYREQFPWVAEANVRIAMDEWNHWYGPHVFGELGTRYFLKDGLGVAAGLHEFFRNSDLFWMANYAQTVNVIGCIKTDARSASFETTGLVLKLYRRHFGTEPVAVESEGLIDAAAAWSPDRRSLTLAVVNASRTSATIPVTIAGATLAGTGRRFTIGGDDPMAFNDPSAPDRVRIDETPVAGFGDEIRVGPCSVTLLVLDSAR